MINFLKIIILKKCFFKIKKKKKKNIKKNFFNFKNIKNNLKKIKYYDNIIIKYYKKFLILNKYIKSKNIMISNYNFIKKKKYLNLLIKNITHNNKIKNILLFWKKKYVMIYKNDYIIKNLIVARYYIKKTIIKNNINYINYIISIFKKKLNVSDFYQDCYSIYKKVILNYDYNNKNIKIFCCWEIKKKIKELIKNNFSKFISLQKPKFNKEFKDSIKNEEIHFLKDHDKNILINLIRNIIKEFPIRDQNIIRLRFGIGYQRNYTLEEIGYYYSLTRERIRQLELKVILKIRLSRSEVLKPYIKFLKQY